MRSCSLRYRHDVAQSHDLTRRRDPWRAWQGTSGRDDALEHSAGPTTRDRRLARVEAVLLVAREPLSSRRLALLANLADGTEGRTLVRKLNTMYDQSATAFRAEEVAGGFQLLSRPKYSPWLRRACGAPAEVRLSAPALETLAVVAYRQPVLRVDVEAVRGVQCGEILRQLLERDLVRIAGRSEELGRPFLYGTTRRFLQLFGLRSLDNLPRMELFRSAKDDSQDQDAPSEHTGESEVSTTIEVEPTSTEIEERIEPGGAPAVEAVITDDHGEFEEDDDDGYEDDDDGGVDDGDVEDADWEEVDGKEDDLDDDDEEWDDYDDDDVDDDEDEK